MDDIKFIKHGLLLQGLPIHVGDIPYIHDILHTIRKTQTSTNTYPYLNEEIPITVFDKGVIR